MKQLLLTLIPSILLIFELQCQVSFESGYIINESGERIECLIRNEDWRNNPVEFSYKITSSDEVKTGSIRTVKEFGVNGFSKYVRDSVEIDRSSDKPDQLSPERNPIFKKEQLFLKTLVEGKASLFYYFDGDLVRFFYKVNGSKINQLVYKPYLIKYESSLSAPITGNVVLGSGSFTPTTKLMAYNNHFRQQLFMDLVCENISKKDMANIKYNVSNLSRLFTKYNKCSNQSYVDYKSAGKQNFFQLTLRAAQNINSLEVDDSGSVLSLDFGKKSSFQFGIETEFIFPFNKNKWSLIIEPTYQNFNAEKSIQTQNVSGGILIGKANYRSIELPIGFRHYFNLNKQSRLFTNISLYFNYPINSKVEYFRGNGSKLSELEINRANRNLALGFGYKYKNRLGLELRYNLKRDVFRDYFALSSNYESLNLILGLSLF